MDERTKMQLQATLWQAGYRPGHPAIRTETMWGRLCKVVRNAIEALTGWR
jgi:hypothetical protein